SFNQPIGSWDVSSVTTMTSMFFSVTLSSSNYDNLLNGWSQLGLQFGVNFDGGNSIYTIAAINARDSIISNFGWSISDGGLEASIPTPPLQSQGIVVNGEVLLSWSISSSDGRSPIIEYRIYRSTISGSGYVLIGASASLSFSDETVTRGESYYYVLRTINAVGESANSEEVTISVPGNNSSITTTSTTTQTETNSQTSATPEASKKDESGFGNTFIIFIFLSLFMINTLYRRSKQ
ncbi:MAG: BspA family leucine-rich repeat surface protein, partial [Candidatus Heimdallarchaeota archaeon]